MTGASAYYDGRVAVVTGGASGIGRELSIGLASRGARVLIADVDLPGAETVVGEITAAGGTARAVAVDVTDAAALAGALDAAIRDFGRLDLMFNNAGISLLGEVRDMTADRWRRVIDVDLIGVAHGSQLALQRMLARRSGHIVNTASMYGLMPLPGLAAYSAAKYGVVGLSRVLRTEARAFGVRVSVICPGYVDTPIHRRTEYLRLDAPRLLASYNVTPISPSYLADEALRRVARGEFLIDVPRSVGTLWNLHKLSEGLTDWAQRRAVRAMRRARVE